MFPRFVLRFHSQKAYGSTDREKEEMFVEGKRSYTIRRCIAYSLLYEILDNGEAASILGLVLPHVLLQRIPSQQQGHQYLH